MGAADDKIKIIDDILNNTIDTINDSREQLLDIVEHTRDEYEKTKQELKETKEKVKEVIKEVDQLEIKERKSRDALVKVSKNFESYTEDDVRSAYEYSNDLRTRLALKREEEKLLIETRKTLELRLKQSLMVLKKAQNISNQVNVVTKYLKGNLDNIITTVDDLSKKQFLGVKVIEAQEEERSRLAREIHDGPAQSLANIVIKAELSEKLIDIKPAEVKKELKELKDSARNTLKEIRNTIYDLRPMSLDDLGLKPTLEKHVNRFSGMTGIDVDLKIMGKIDKLDSAIEIAIFRVIQEGLNNVYKHSRAGNVNITIENAVKRINLVMSDNGVGFNVEEKLESATKLGGGYGIISMKERVELLGGELELRSYPGKGTRIFLYIPINEGDIQYE